MPRRPARSLVALALVAAAWVYVGCNGRVAPPSPPPAPPAATPVAASSKPAARLESYDDWPAPAVVLAITGQQDGYQDPCGCTEGQDGGLGRRFDLLEKLAAKGWTVVPIDLGSLIDDPNKSPGGPLQVDVKLGITLQALQAMKYRALALSSADLKLGVSNTLGKYRNLEPDGPAVVCANVAAGEDLAATIRPSMRIEAGGMVVGVTAVVDPAAIAALEDPDRDLLLTVTDPATALAGVLADLEKDTQFQVVMVQGPTALAESLAAANPGIDLVVAASDLPEPAPRPTDLNGGKTRLITVGHKGQHVGLVGLYPDKPDEPRYQRVQLNGRFAKAEPMRRLVDEDYPGQLRDMLVLELAPRRDFVGGAPGAKFVGAEGCKDCHPKTFEKWASTKHAQAYEVLVADPHDARRNREPDAECVSCHTTGFGYTTGFVTAAASPLLRGNQCENCHGPASRHVAEPDDPEFRASLALTAERADRENLCLRCHDGDNDPHFQFAVRYPMIAHPDLDTYDDPKVHQSSTAP